ncbi:hypothetical protein [Streptomyces sp. NPDC050485]|uniref:hypothetical protein n=1 Tax=Streptomyces sp. NPDC050485 TaxID=3365617 RepID=UPI0037AB7000
MSTYIPSRRLALRAAVATAALAGALLTPAAALAATPAAGSAPAERCGAKSCADPGDATYKLVNGEILPVHRFATNHYRAEFVTNGRVVKIMETDGGDIDAYVHGMHVTLNSSTGKVNSEYAGGRSGCTVTEVVPSVFNDAMSVKLTNGPAGPKAVLRDSALRTISSADRAHPVDTRMGLRVDGANTATPKLGQRTQGGNTPYAYTAFPKLPAGCAAGQTPVTAPTQNGGQADVVPKGGQTGVVPKGAVAAGAEFEQQSGDENALIAGGAGLAAAGGAGFVLLRRRAAGRA